MSSAVNDPISDGREAAFADQLIDSIESITYSDLIAPALESDGIEI